MYEDIVTTHWMLPSGGLRVPKGISVDHKPPYKKNT